MEAIDFPRQGGIPGIALCRELLRREAHGAHFAGKES